MPHHENLDHSDMVIANLADEVQKQKQDISRLREAIKEAIEELEYDFTNGTIVCKQLKLALKEPK